MNKKTAIKIMNEHYGSNSLNNKNVSFANINASKDVWWFDISLKAVSGNEEINLLMYDAKTNVIHHLCVPTDYFSSNLDQFKVRSDKNCISLELSAEKHMLFRDIRPTSGRLKFDEFLKTSLEMISE